ncbi:MAG TPA: hypothetical protein GX690_01655 [Tenericutes bacterium]|nr:hypothetical protein [Mycoplasmatota bacterium]
MNGYQLEKRPKTLANHILITIFLIFLVLINQLFLLKYFSLIQFLFSIMNIIVLVYILIAPRYYDFENENFATAYFIMVILSFLTKNYILLVISAILVYNIWKETKKA